MVRNRKVPEEEMGKQVYTVQGRRWSTGKDKKIRELEMARF